MKKTRDGQTDWRRRRRAALRWSLWGLLPGALAALVIFAPAAWLVPLVADASDQRLLLADARGTVWSGSAVPVLTGGAGSLDAAALPGRLSWRIGLAEGSPLALALRARHDCCLDGEFTLRIEPGWGRLRLALPARPGPLGQWPAAWLSGLGTPFNTVTLGGSLRLSNEGLALVWADGRLRMDGRATLEMRDISSRLSTLGSLGSYRLQITGQDPAAAPAPPPAPPGRAPATPALATLSLTTIDGALRLSGSGQWSPAGLRLRGDARAAEGSEAVLNNLLNIIGRRQGALAIISIG